MKAVGRTKKIVASAALVVAGFAAGGAVAVTGSASAATEAVSSGVSQAASRLDPTKSIRPDEHLLTGPTASKVRAAALAKYPNATVQRVETDSDGVYEAHIVTASGDQVIVQVGADFAVTGTQTGGPGGSGGTPPAQGGDGA
jgi:hypothetical protein